MSKQYTEEFKQEAIRLATTSPQPIAKTISPNSLDAHFAVSNNTIKVQKFFDIDKILSPRLDAA